jgi:hypothetical protein
VVPVAIAGADQQHPGRIPLGRKGSLWLPPVPLPVKLDYWFGVPMSPPLEATKSSVDSFAAEVTASAEALLSRALLSRIRLTRARGGKRS